MKKGERAVVCGPPTRKQQRQIATETEHGDVCWLFLSLSPLFSSSCGSLVSRYRLPPFPPNTHTAQRAHESRRVLAFSYAVGGLLVLFLSNWGGACPTTPAPLSLSSFSRPPFVAPHTRSAVHLLLFFRSRSAHDDDAKRRGDIHPSTSSSAASLSTCLPTPHTTQVTRMDPALPFSLLALFLQPHTHAAAHAAPFPVHFFTASPAPATSSP